jgi:hypothetical protein
LEHPINFDMHHLSVKLHLACRERSFDELHLQCRINGAEWRPVRSLCGRKVQDYKTTR